MTEVFPSLQMPCTTRCVHCDWQHQGTVIEGSELHTTHRQQAHGIQAGHRWHAPKQRSWGTRYERLESNIAAARAEGAPAWSAETIVHGRRT